MEAVRYEEIGLIWRELWTVKSLTDGSAQMESIIMWAQVVGMTVDFWALKNNSHCS